MLIPSRTKYRRVHRLPYEGRSRGNRELSFGEYGLQAKEGAWITANQIETSRKQILQQDEHPLSDQLSCLQFCQISFYIIEFCDFRSSMSKKVCNLSWG